MLHCYLDVPSPPDKKVSNIHKAARLSIMLSDMFDPVLPSMHNISISLWMKYMAVDSIDRHLLQ